MKILVVTEQRQGKWNNTSFETLVARSRSRRNFRRCHRGSDR